MAKVSKSQKAERVLLLLLGLADDRIAIPLRDAGFKSSDIEEGWTLLRRQTRSDFDDLPATDPARPTGALDAIRAWHKTWFSMVASTLVRRYPAVHEALFGDLGDLSANAVLATSGLLSRWHRLESGAGEAAAARDAFPQARDLLAQRGFTEAVVNEARKLMDDSKRLSSPEEALAQAEADAYEPAERDLWAYYLEWSPVIRRVIKDQNLLRKLGMVREHD